MKRLFFALAVTVSMSAQTVEVVPSTPAGRQLKAQLDAGAETNVRNVYAPIGFRLIWSHNGQPTPQALAVIAQFRSSDAKALDSSRYHFVANDPVQFDIAMTSALVRYASDLRIGRVRPGMQFELDTDSRQVYLPALVLRTSEAADAAAVLSELEPQHEDYRRLVAALATWRRIATDSANDAPLPVVTKVVPGDAYAAIPQLAARLRTYGDLTGDFTGTAYEGVLVDAVKHFQSRHGLDADGVISSRTFAALNVPASQRVQQIAMAIERWRWAGAASEGPSIVVNIPEFRLTARNAAGETMEMRVVVGRASRNETPVFEGDLRHVVFRPTWSVPPSIQKGEIAPKLEKDPEYLARNNYEIVDAAGNVVGTSVDAQTIARISSGALRVRQKAGTSNALGLVKFYFPNDNNVYLHSTPQQSLFARTRRDFSHGCIRVEDPTALAAFFLGWTPEKVQAAMNGKTDDLYVKLPQSVNVRILYSTAVARANGEMNFFEDIYGHDVELAKALSPQTKAAPMLVAAK
jgi:murein L,D-transpeptidase YcbB/YkuD